MNDGINGYLLYHPRLGAYLGFDGQQHRWSGLNPGASLTAVAFPTLESIREFIGDWPMTAGSVAVPVKACRRAGGFYYATLEACVEAGISRGWLSPSTPCAGPIQ